MSLQTSLFGTAVFDLPFAYGLSYQDEQIKIRVHEEVVKDINSWPQTSWFCSMASRVSQDVLGYEATWNCYHITEPGPFGLDGYGTYSLDDGCHCLSFSLPKKVYTNKRARAQLELVIANLSLFFDAIMMIELDYQSEHHQLCTITFLGSEEGHQKAGFNVEISSLFADWLSATSEEIMTQVSSVIAGVNKRLAGKPDGYGELARRALLNSNNQLIVADNIDGNGSIGPMDRSWCKGYGRGYTLSSHNIDSFVQSLAILIGLSTLVDIADREINQGSL